MNGEPGYMNCFVSHRMIFQHFLSHSVLGGLVNGESNLAANMLVLSLLGESAYKNSTNMMSICSNHLQLVGSRSRRCRPLVSSSVTEFVTVRSCEIIKYHGATRA